MVEKGQVFGVCDRCGKTILVGSRYWYEKEQRLLPDKKFCSNECFVEAFTEEKDRLIKEGKLPPEWISETAGKVYKSMIQFIVVASILFVAFMIWLWFYMFG